VATAVEHLDEPFSRTQDRDHPVRWSPADGDTPAYLTLKGAAERLASHFALDRKDVEWYAYELAAGRRFQTAVAFYVVDEPFEIVMLREGSPGSGRYA
jgi:hypothetical protein